MSQLQEISFEDKLVDLLVKEKMIISVVESCTGGLLAGTILNVPGASGCFHEGYITYSNEAKTRLVGVKEDTLTEHGAVSPETAKEMVTGLAGVAHADVAISVTGIAGPGGGTKDKPVGLVYIGIYICGNIRILKNEFVGTREEIRNQAIQMAIVSTVEGIENYLQCDMTK